MCCVGCTAQSNFKPLPTIVLTLPVWEETPVTLSSHHWLLRRIFQCYPLYLPMWYGWKGLLYWIFDRDAPSIFLLFSLYQVTKSHTKSTLLRKRHIGVKCVEKSYLSPLKFWLCILFWHYLLYHSTVMYILTCYRSTDFFIWMNVYESFFRELSSDCTNKLMFYCISSQKLYVRRPKSYQHPWITTEKQTKVRLGL